MNTLSSWAWPASGAPGAVARVGIASAATASTSRTAIVRTGAAPKRWTPWRMPPAKNARPRTSRLLARIDPTSAVWTTTTSPAWSAKNEMNSSGRLPRADWRTPVLPGPSRYPSWSVPAPMTPASPASAIADTTKTAASGAPPKRRTAVAIVAPIATTRSTSAVRPSSSGIDEPGDAEAVTLR